MYKKTHPLSSPPDSLFNAFLVKLASPLALMMYLMICLYTSSHRQAMSQPLSSQPVMTYLGQLPVKMRLTCLNCPLKGINDRNKLIGHEVTLAVQISLNRNLSIPFKLQLNSSPTGLILEKDLPKVILTQSKETYFTFTLLIEEGFIIDRASSSENDVSMTISYQSEHSGLTQRLTWHPRELLADLDTPKNDLKPNPPEVLKKVPLPLPRHPFSAP